MSLLSLLVVTRCEPHTPRFFTHYRAVADMLGIPWVLAVDRCEPPDWPKADRVLKVTCNAAIEDVLVEAHQACDTPWVLRLDDDETLCPKALPWLAGWIANPIPDVNAFAIPRANLWNSEQERLHEPFMYPDHQVRLLKKELEIRTQVHEGIANVSAETSWIILHHKFLVKSRAEREEIARRYESYSGGLGLGEHYVRFSLPELVFGDNPQTTPVYKHKAIEGTVK
jgi:hypothetical protein